MTILARASALLGALLLALVPAAVTLAATTPEMATDALAEGGPGKPLGEALGEGFGLFPGKPRGLGPVFLKAPQEEVHGVLRGREVGALGEKGLGALL